MNCKFAEALKTLQCSKPQQVPAYNQDIIMLAREQLLRITTQLKLANQKKKQYQQNNQYQQYKAFIEGKNAALFDELYRIKRFLLIYSNYRTSKIEDQFWHFGGDIKNTQKGNLSEKQKKYLLNYKTIVMDYVDDLALDLTTDLEPPLQTHVAVRFQEDCGQIMNEKGQVIKLSKNEGGFMKKRVVEGFLRQGQATISK